MKKQLFFVFLILQTSFYPQKQGHIQPITSWYNNVFESEEIPWLKVLANGKSIRSLKTFGGNDNSISLTLLSKNGKIIEKKDDYLIKIAAIPVRKYLHQQMQYNDAGDIEQVKFFNREGAEATRYNYQYFSPRKINHSISYNKGKKRFEEFAAFNADTTVKNHTSFTYSKGKARQRSRTEYEYYEGKQLKQSRFYNSKNKLKHTWVYDCSPKGEIKPEKTTQICKNAYLDERGRQVTVYINTLPNGKKTKSVVTGYHSNGKAITVQTEMYAIEKGKEKLLWKVHHADSIEPYYTYTHYDNKSRLSSERRHEYALYNSNQKILKSKSFKLYNKKNTVTLNSTEKFDEKGLLLGAEWTGKNNKFLGSTEMKYEGDSLYQVNSYDKKRRLKSTLTGRISYY